MAGVVSLAVVNAFKQQIIDDPSDYAHHVDFCWRLLIGLGAVPGVVALYFRLTLPETPRFTMDVERNIKRAAADVDGFLHTGDYNHHETNIAIVNAPVATKSDFLAHFSKWENGKVLFGCAWSWFALDVAFYGYDASPRLVVRLLMIFILAVLDSIRRLFFKESDSERLLLDLAERSDTKHSK